MAVFRKVWSQLTEELTDITDVFGDRLIQDSLEMLSLSSRESSAAATARFKPSSSDYRWIRKRSSNSNIKSICISFFRMHGHADLIGAIDENKVFHGGGPSDLSGYLSTALNMDDNPVSLPNLRPVGSFCHYRNPSCKTSLVFFPDPLQCPTR